MSVKIYCNKIKAKSKKKFIIEFIKHNFPKTTKDEDEEVNQCISGSKRSFDDIYLLTKTRFKSTTKKEVAKIMFDLIIDKKIFSFFCPSIYKVVFTTDDKYWFFKKRNIRQRIKERAFKKPNGTSFNDILVLVNRVDLIHEKF